MTHTPQWLDWAQRLQAVAQTGLSYQPSAYDRERYEAVARIAAEMLAAHSTENADALIELFAAQTGHATPKIDVRAAIFRDDKILMVQEISDNRRWTLPGGWADIGESAGESVVREVYEETGYRARAVKLMALYDRSKHDHPPFAFYAYKTFFRCELIDGVRRPDPHNVETGEIGWFALEALPELSTPRITVKQIARFFEHYRNPSLPTDFD